MSATASVNEFKTFPADNKLMVPLNTSLYVPGNVVTTDKLLVELGTGYYCEKPADGALKVGNTSHVYHK
jgi:prefoldin alpha subunit